MSEKEEERERQREKHMEEGGRGERGRIEGEKESEISAT